MYCCPIFHSHHLGEGVTLQARPNSLVTVIVIYMWYVVQYSARLLVALIPLLRSMCGSGEPILLDIQGAYHGQVCVEVLGAHLVLLVLAALVICVCYM